MIKKNETYILKIEDINNLGYGVGFIDGLVVFVAGAVPGDEVEVLIIKKAKSYCVGKILNYIKESELKIDGCVYSKKCGGCIYQNLSYQYELELKKKFVEFAFKKEGVDVDVADVFPSQNITEYRNKAQFPVSYDLKIGYYREKSHDIVEIENCRLVPKEFSEIVKTLKDFFKSNNIKGYDEITGKGEIRHIFLRIGKVTGDIMVCLVINCDTFAKSRELVEELTTKYTQIKSIVLNVNKEDTNVITGRKFINLYGDGYIVDVMCGVKLRISPSSFYQVNHDAAENIYKKAAEIADLNYGDTVLDLYCGIGSIGLSMARKVRHVMGVEIVEDAIENAKTNASINNIDNAVFYCADAAKAIALAKKDNLSPNVIILDPPRKGCSEKLIDDIINISPEKIVYISCNPNTLARDVKLLTKAGYIPGPVYPYDLFPRTGHVECVMRLQRDNITDN